MITLPLRIATETELEAATALYLWPIGKAVPKWAETQAKMQAFSGEAGKLLFTPKGVVLGVGDESDPLILGAASAALPQGEYHLKTPLKGRKLELALEGWAMGGYRFTRYRAQKPAPILLVEESASAQKAICRAEAVYLTRDLVNTPAGDLGPEALEQAARALAKEFSAEISVVTGDDLLKQNFGMIHAVGRAAQQAPRLLDMRWGNKTAPKITLVGKGVCFDSGGLNIKGASSMLLMKKDMGGSANVLGLARMIMSAKLNIRLRVLIPAVENAISGNAFRPGDILKSRKGLTVEIGNTDAEGRLVLGDALTLAGEESPEHIISLATLTGAARVALGPEIMPFYTTNEKVAQQLAKAADAVADPLWRMPFWPGYDVSLASPIADMNNISSDGFAGSVVAAMFLKRFVPQGANYTHFDIYAWNAKDRPARPKGGEATAIRALFEWLSSDYGR